MEDIGWDLEAVVRGCCGTPAATAAAMEDPFCSFPPLLQEGWGEQDDLLFRFPELFGTRTEIHELEELWKPFFPESPQQQQQLLLSPQRSSSSCGAAPQLPAGGRAALTPLPQQQLPPPPQRTPPHTPKLKRRKNQQKRVVCQVPADGLSSDMWAWRKYGQKPIKGSPYPRGYYRCSSSKGCVARKQVERSRVDPGMFVITYTGEHNHSLPTHRNSLAGSTRQKFPSSSSPARSPAANSPRKVNAPGGAAAAGGPPEQPDCKASPSSPLSSPSAAGLSPTESLTDSMEEELQLSPPGGRQGRGADGAEEEGKEEDLLLVGDMEMLGEDDVLFLDFGELNEPNAGTGAGTGEAFSDAFYDHFIAFPPPLMANNTATAAGGS